MSYEDLDDERTGNPDGISGPEIPEAPEPPAGTSLDCIDGWGDGWVAGYRAALLDRGVTS